MAPSPDTPPFGLPQLVVPIPRCLTQVALVELRTPGVKRAAGFWLFRGPASDDAALKRRGVSRGHPVLDKRENCLGLQQATYRSIGDELPSNQGTNG
jgi:hypothetical protein